LGELGAGKTLALAYLGWNKKLNLDLACSAGSKKADVYFQTSAFMDFLTQKSQLSLT
jgi:hypothetical protein